MKRRDLLRSAPFVVPALMASRVPRVSAAESTAKMNVILFLTDQERSIQHFPSAVSGRTSPA